MVSGSLGVEGVGLEVGSVDSIVLTSDGSVGTDSFLGLGVEGAGFGVTVVFGLGGSTSGLEHNFVSS